MHDSQSCLPCLRLSRPRLGEHDGCPSVAHSDRELCGIIVEPQVMPACRSSMVSRTSGSRVLRISTRDALIALQRTKFPHPAAPMSMPDHPQELHELDVCT